MSLQTHHQVLFVRQQNTSFCAFTIAFFEASTQNGQFKSLIFGAAFVFYFQYNSQVKKETSKKIEDHTVKNFSQLCHSLRDMMQFTVLKMLHVPEGCSVR